MVTSYLYLTVRGLIDPGLWFSFFGEVVEESCDLAIAFFDLSEQGGGEVIPGFVEVGDGLVHFFGLGGVFCVGHGEDEVVGSFFGPG